MKLPKKIIKKKFKGVQDHPGTHEILSQKRKNTTDCVIQKIFLILLRHCLYPSFNHYKGVHSGIPNHSLKKKKCGRSS